MFEYDTVNRWVFRRLRKVSSDGADVTSGGRLFQTWGPATGKALSPTVDRLDCGWIMDDAASVGGAEDRRKAYSYNERLIGVSRIQAFDRYNFDDL